MSATYITVQSESPEDVAKAVQEVSDLYADMSFSRAIRILKMNDGKTYVILFSYNPTFEDFKYFVNYLYYPHCKICLNNIRGFITLKDLREMLFIPENNSDEDIIYTVNSEGETVKHGLDYDEGYQPLAEIIVPYNEPAINLDDSIAEVEIYPGETIDSTAKNGYLSCFFGV